MDATDAELLRRYTREGSEPAFRELVQRHLNLVYAVAWRHLRSHALAADAAQLVFIDLACSAGSLSPAQPLVAWLHVVARRTALDAVRAEQRRQLREQTAAELAAMNAVSSEWSSIEPLLDEALEMLDETDRHALLLRFFENRSLREVGAALGTSDDAAQKRVSRALEELRSGFARRGIVLTAAGMAANLSAHAAGPDAGGLAAVVASQALPHAAPAVSALTMTTLNKSLLVASLVLIAGLVYEGRLVAAGRDDMAIATRQLASDRVAAQQLRDERARVAADLTAAHQRLGLAHSRAEADAAMESALDAWLGRVTKLKQWFEANPGQTIPEMRYLTSNDWLTATLDNYLHHPGKVRLAAADVRRMAKFKPEIMNNLSSALQRYRHDHEGKEATSIADLQPYLNPALDDDILQRYEFLPPNTDGYNGGPIVLTERALPDEDFDAQIFFGTNGSTGNRNGSKLVQALSQAYRAFHEANPTQTVTQAEQVLPYLTPPVDEARVRAYLDALKP